MISNRDITLKLKILVGKSNILLKEQLEVLKEHARVIDKIEKKSKGLFKNWEKGIIVWNQGLELIKKLGMLLNTLKVPLFEAGAFEGFTVTMKNLIGSAEIAKRRFKELIDFAAVTPFNVPGIIEAGNRLEALGRYSIDLIRNLGDLASASGKPVMQAVEAYTNLVTGRTGIAIKQFRAMLIATSDWTRAIGKQVLQNGSGVKASVEEMVEALPKIIAEKNFTGLMEQQSKTFLGKISNLEDSFQQAMASIGDQFLEGGKNVIDWLKDVSEWVRDHAPTIIQNLKDFGYWVKELFKTLLAYKVVTSMTKSFYVFKNLLFGMKLPFNVMQKAIKKNIDAVKLYKIELMLANKYGRGAIAYNTQLGKAYKKLTGGVKGARASILKLGFAMRAVPFVAIIGAILGIVSGLTAWRKANRINYATEVKLAEARKRELDDNIKRIKVIKDVTESKRDLLVEYLGEIKVNDVLDSRNKKHSDILLRLKKEYGSASVESGKFKMSLSDVANTIRDLNKDIGEQADKLAASKKEMADLNIKLIELNSLAKEQAFIDKTITDSIDDYTAAWSRQMPILGNIFGTIVGWLDRIFGYTDSIKYDNITAITDVIRKAKNLGDLDKFYKLQKENIKNSVLSDKEKTQLLLHIKEVYNDVNNKIKAELTKEFTPFDELLKLKLSEEKKKQSVKEYVNYLKDLQEKIIDGGKRYLSVGDKKIPIEVYGAGMEFDKKATEERIRATNKIISDALKIAESNEKTVEKTKLQKQQAYNKLRANALKEQQEKLRLLILRFNDSEVKDYEKYKNDIVSLEKEFKEKILDIYKNSNSSELQHKIKLRKEEEKVDEIYFKDQKETLEKHLKNLNIKKLQGKDVDRDIKGTLIDELNRLFDKGFDPDKATKSAKSYYSFLVKELKNITKDINESDLLRFYIKLYKSQKDGKSLEESIKGKLSGLDAKDLTDVMDMVDTFADRNKKKREAAVSSNKELDNEERIKQLYEANKESLTEHLDALKLIKIQLEDNISSGKMSIKEEGDAIDLILELESKISDLKNKLSKSGSDYADDMSDNLIKNLRKMIRGVSSFTSNFKKAVNAWYENVRDSVDKQVSVWLEGQKKMIDAEEERALKFARTKRQEERIREDAEEKRIEAEKKADKETYERLKGWFELKKAADIASVISSTATAIISAWTPASGTNANPLLAIPLTALIASTGAAQIAAITQQEFPTKGFSVGGPTYGDEKKIAGVVHGQEYVIKKGPAQRYRAILDMINAENISGFADGGFTSDTINVSRDLRLKNFLDNYNSKMLIELSELNKNMQNYIKSPIIAKAYFDNREAEKIVNHGVSKMKRGIL